MVHFVTQNSFSRALKFEFGTENESRDFCSAVEKCRHGKINGTSEGMNLFKVAVFFE